MYFRINFDMDLTKIDKSRIRESEKGGKYANFTVFCNTDKVYDDYGNSGFVSQALNKQDFDNQRNGIELPEMPNIGKARVVYPKSDVAVEPQNTKPKIVDNNFDDDIDW
jgi:hypothetical protein|tara:strand:+ start:779 stop:1105 length:327 start_codon:yes stop_codon:yes gene_type:complete